MITQVRFCINHSSKIRKFASGEPRLRFQPGYNVLIGPNGSGKSTVLRALATCSMCTVDGVDREHIKYITTETLNPLIGGHFSSRDEMIQGIRAMFKSHGQSVLDTLQSQCHADETVVIIDSPETGQDLRNSLLIHEGLLKMSERYQVIVATNSLAFMQGGHLIDLGKNSLAMLLDATESLVTRLRTSAQCPPCPTPIHGRILPIRRTRRPQRSASPHGVNHRRG